MCGVAVSVGGESDSQVSSMLRSMSHRGLRSRIEGNLSRYSEGWFIGHVRLPIVGTGEDNDQPARSGCGRWTVAFVGEILDFRERRPGADCDLGLVVDTWAESGPEGFREFDGFWSVAVWDHQDRQMHLLVDYLSQKPLYVRDDVHALAAASEPDAVARLGPVDLDKVYLSSVVKFGYCPETWRTPYVGVRRMSPGEHAAMDYSSPIGDRVQYNRVDVLTSLPMPPESLKREVEAAVRRRVLSSDVPVACLVSGGLDSSVVYTLARRHGNVRAYHVENGEVDACQAVAAEAVHLDLMGVSLVDAVAVMEEPLDLGSLLPQVALARAVAASGAERVVLTGDGADEAFGGYGRSLRYDSQYSDIFQELVSYHLPRLDRVHMRHLQEVRSPFLARRVVSAALALPRPDRTDKRILRDLFRGDLPTGTADLLKRPLRVGPSRGNQEERESYRYEVVQSFLKGLESRGIHVCRA